jgi:hypothetical protein
MKKIIYVTLAAILIAVLAGTIANSKNARDLVAKATDLVISKKIEKFSGGVNPLLPLKQESELGATSPTLEDMEADIGNLSKKELEDMLHQNDQFIKENHLIELANAGKLTSTDAEKLTNALRKNTVFNKILLEKELEEFKSESL